MQANILVAWLQQDKQNQFFITLLAAQNQSEYEKVIKADTQDIFDQSLTDCLLALKKQTTTPIQSIYLIVESSVTVNSTTLYTNNNHQILISGEKFATRLNVQKFILKNHFAALCKRLLTVKDSQKSVITPAQRLHEELALAIQVEHDSFNVVLLIPEKLAQSGYIAKQTEAGHVSFPSGTSELLIEFNRFLRLFLKQEHVSLNQALQVTMQPELLQDFLRQSEKFGCSYSGTAELQKRILRETIQNAIGDLLLAFQPYGGTYLTGSVLKIIKDDLIQNKFLIEYISTRQYMNALFKKLPVYIVQEEEEGHIPETSSFLAQIRTIIEDL